MNGSRDANAPHLVEAEIRRDAAFERYISVLALRGVRIADAILEGRLTTALQEARHIRNLMGLENATDIERVVFRGECGTRPECLARNG